MLIVSCSALERMSGKIVNSARHPNTPLVRSADHDMDLENKVDLNDEHEVRSSFIYEFIMVFCFPRPVYLVYSCVPVCPRCLYGMD